MSTRLLMKSVGVSVLVTLSMPPMLRAMELQSVTMPPLRMSAVAAAMRLAQNDAVVSPDSNTSTTTAVQSVENAVGSPQTTAPEPAFDIFEFRVQGVTLLKAGDIERAVYPYMGSHKTMQDVEKARASVEQVYKDAGYPTGIVSIPEQQVSAGIVRLLVTEAKIGRLKVSGSKYYSPRDIRLALPSLAQGKVPYLPEIQAELENLNSSTGDRSVVPVMKAGREPGTLDVELKVNDQAPLHGKLEANNRSSATTTASRAQASLNYDNLWQAQHSLALQYQTSPEKTSEVRFYVLSYSLPISEDNERLTLYTVKSSSDVAAGQDFSVVGKGHIYGARISTNLARTPELFQTVSFGADYKDFSETLQQQGADTGNTPITYLPFNLHYDAARRREQSLLHAGFGATWAIHGFKSDQQQFNDKRFLAQSNFFFLSADLGYQYQYANGSRWSSRIAVQWTDQALISNEQFGIGGAQSVRGYYESQALGDRGQVASLEWESANLAKSTWLDDSRWHFFYDVGTVTINNALPGQIESFYLASTGIGFRATAWKQLHAELDAGYALRPLGTITKGDIRIHARLAYEF